MKYFMGSYSNSLSPKNKLEKAIQEYLKKYHRKLMTQTSIEPFKVLISKDIEALNKKFSNCTPKKPYWWIPARSLDDEIVDYVLSGIDCARLSFECCKRWIYEKEK